MRDDEDLITTPDGPAEPEPEEAEERSVMRELLGEEADRFEVAPGRWYLPGAPP